MAPASILLHGLLALPASLNFFRLSLAPTSAAALTLTPAILRNYAALLLSTSLVSLALALLPPAPAQTAAVRAAMGVYHLAPIARALGRIGDGITRERTVGRDMGGPWVHLGTHVVVLGLLLRDVVRLLA